MLSIGKSGAVLVAIPPADGATHGIVTVYAQAVSSAAVAGGAAPTLSLKVPGTIEAALALTTGCT